MEPEERNLSDRERTVLLLAAEGLTDKEIAKHLNLSQRTIGTYWERMRHKLGPYSRTQLVARFLRLEADLERTSENFRNLFATWDEGVWILSPNGTTIYANQPIAALLGFKLDNVLQVNARDLFKEAAGIDIGDLLRDAQDETRSIEFQMPRPDGGTIWLHLRGAPITDRRGKTSAIVLLVQDISVQKRVRHTLDSCRVSLDFIAQHCTDPVARFDADLNCVSVNSAFERALGVAPGDVVGKPLKDLGETFAPANVWRQGLLHALASDEVQTIRTEWKSLGRELTTHLMPEPSIEFRPVTILSITPLPEA